MKKNLMAGLVCLLILCAAGFAQADVILSEDFSSGMPGTWTVADSSTWSQNPAGGPDGYTWTVVSGAAVSSNNGYDPQNDHLITPILDCSIYTGVSLSFDHSVAPWEYSGYAYVDIRINGGSWTNLVTYEYPDDVNETKIINISSYADGQDSVEVRWYNYSISDDWTVDDVSITGTAVVADDIAAVSIDNPAVSMATGIAYTPKVTAINNGTATQVFDLNLVILDGSLVEVYNQTQTGISLDASLSTQVTFATDFTPSTAGTYTLTALVQNPGDQNATNDTVSEAITAYQHYGTGGPDTFGHTWKDNTVVGGPTFNYIDITGSRTVVGNGDDNAFGPLPIGFSFPFYNTSYTEFYVNTNGQITMTGPNTSTSNTCPVPTSFGAEYWISPFWDDLDVRSTDAGNIYYQYFDDTVDYLVIQWHNFSRYGKYGDPMDMEAILYANGDIIFQYNYVNNLDISQGQQATVGMEDDETDGLTYLCNDDNPGNRLHSGLAIGWYPPVISHDVGVTSIAPSAPLVVDGAGVDVVATLTNLAVNPDTFDTYLEIKNSSAVVVFADTTNIAVAAGMTGQASFDTWTVGGADDYTITVISDLTGDQNPNNDTLSSSITSVATVSLPVNQDFEGAFPPPGWTVFDFGGADPWTLDNLGTPHYRSPIHSAQAKYDWFADSDDWLVMAPIDMSAGSNISWLFYEEDSDSYPFTVKGLRHSFYVTTDIYFEPDSLTPFVTHLPTNHDVDNFSGDPIVFDLTSFAGNSNVWLAFRFENTPVNTEYWWIDDISVFSVPDADVGVYSIDSPPLATIENCDASVGVTVKNYGLAAQTFNVNVTITGDVLGLVYDQTVNVANLDPDSSQAVVFPDFTEPQSDDYVVSATTQLSGDENTSNDTLTKDIYVSTTIMHTWDDDEADGNMSPLPFNNTMVAVKYTPFATDFTILGGHIYIDDYNPDINDYAEFEWVKICPDVAGAPDTNNPYGTIDSIGTYSVPILIPINIPDTIITSYTGDIWIVAKYWDAATEWLCLGIDTDGPDGYSYFTQLPSYPSWTQVTNRDYMMRIEVQYAPCGPEGYAYLPADMGMYYPVWPPAVQGGDVTYYVNFMRQYASSVPCFFDGPLGSFWASADVNGSCAVDGADLSTLVSVMRNILDPMYCDQYPTIWPTPLDLPPTEPAGWPNCENTPVTGARVIPTNPIR